MKTLASLAAILTLAVAGAASAQEARIGWSDLDLSSPAGAAAFDARIEAASRTLCRSARRTQTRINDRTACEAAVRAEAVRQLPARVKADYARNRGLIAV